MTAFELCLFHLIPTASVCECGCEFTRLCFSQSLCCCTYRTNDPQVEIAGSFDKLLHFSKLFFDIKITYGVEEQNLNTVTKAKISHAKPSQAKQSKTEEKSLKEEECEERKKLFRT